MSMMPPIPAIRRIAASATLLGLALILSGCFLAPGKFTSQLELYKDRSFSFSYAGEIFLLPLTEDPAEGDDEFTPEECLDDDYNVRPCNPAELASQRAEWESNAPAREQERKQQGAMAAAMMGGFDPSDPAAAEKFAAGLRRQKGWERVEYRGDGLFDVSFSIEGSLDTDFVYPTIEGFPMANFFVLVANRKGDVVRIEAPGFSAQDAASPLKGMMSGMAGMTPAPEEEGEQPSAPPKIDGTFRIVTDGGILANNTDEGPGEMSGSRVLEWQVDAGTMSAPTALIQL